MFGRNSTPSTGDRVEIVGSERTASTSGTVTGTDSGFSQVQEDNSPSKPQWFSNTFLTSENR